MSLSPLPLIAQLLDAEPTSIPYDWVTSAGHSSVQTDMVPEKELKVPHLDPLAADRETGPGLAF